AYLLSFTITTALGLNFFACCTSNLSLEWAVKISTSNLSGLEAITSRACVPMEPVEPNIAIRFFIQFCCEQCSSCIQDTVCKSIGENYLILIQVKHRHLGYASCR